MELRDLRETARLARLRMSEQELQEALPAFEQMLSFFAAMQAAERDGVLPLDSGGAFARTAGPGHFRPDTVCPQSGADFPERMLAQAGERDGRFVVIPNVL